MCSYMHDFWFFGLDGDGAKMWVRAFDYWSLGSGTGGTTMNPILLSTQKALRSCTGASKVRPAAMKVERRMRCDEGE